MANLIQFQTLVDGPRNTVIKCDVSLDGSGDPTGYTIVADPAQLCSTGPNTGIAKRLAVSVIDWDMQDGLACSLWWDGGVAGAGNAPLWRLVGRSMEKAWHIGNLQNNADLPTGKISLSVKSESAGTALYGTFKIHCVKQP